VEQKTQSPGIPTPYVERWEEGESHSLVVYEINGIYYILM
jgi:hypothetical protein